MALAIAINGGTNLRIPSLQMGCTGVTIAITLTNLGASGAALDLTTFTAQMLFFTPAGVTLTRAATVESPATSGIISYVSTSAEFDAIGEWGVQGVAIKTGVRYPSTVGTIRVLPNRRLTSEDLP